MAWISWSENPITFTILIGVLVEIGAILQAAYKQIYSHPLSNYPGPRLAALTTYRKAYIELILGKSWHIELRDLHKKYGSVVRVGPNELHFSNPKAFADIYNDSNRWDKEEDFYHSTGEDLSCVGALTYEDAQSRRKTLNRSFFTSAVQSVRPLILKNVEALSSVLTQSAKTNAVVDLHLMAQSIMVDITTTYVFGRSADAIHAADFSAPIVKAINACRRIFVACKHFTIYRDLILKGPSKLSRAFDSSASELVTFQKSLRQMLEDSNQDLNESGEVSSTSTVYSALLNSEAYEEPGSQDEEAQALLVHGSDTVASTMMVALFHLLRDPAAVAKLKAELQEAWIEVTASCPSSEQLSRLSLFNACIKEALRLNSGLVSGLPRVVPEGGAKIDGHQIPEETIVSIGSTFVHYNADIFPEPDQFRPERWLRDQGLDQWLVAFSKGPRSCLGSDLALAEIRLVLASILRRFDLELDPSGPDKLVFRDCLLPDYQGPHVKAHITIAKQ